MFDCILKHATRLCDAHLGVLGSYDGEKYQTLAQLGASKKFAKYLMGRGPFVPPPGSAFRKMITERQPASLADYKDTAAYRERAPNIVALVELGGVRTFVVAPMLKQNRVVGGIAIYRREVRPFSDKQVALLRSFADQAAIAIDNVRLVNETRQALESQTAIAEVLKVTSNSPNNLQPVFDAIATNAARLTRSAQAVLVTVDGNSCHVVAQFGISTVMFEYLKSNPILLSNQESIVSRAVAARQAVQVEDVLADSHYGRGDIQKIGGFRTLLGVPILRDGVPIGVLSLSRTEVRAFTGKEMNLAASFADQAAIAIENVRLFNETREALERQTATAEILRVISSSPTDVAPVFDAIAKRARVLCGALVGATTRFDGELLHMVGYHGATPEAEAVMRGLFPLKPGPGSINGRCLLARAPVQIPDVRLEVGYDLNAAAQAAQYLSLLAVPMLLGGQPIGVIGVTRREAGTFPDKAVELLQAFADQAVIAIENVRLFNETKESLERQTATADILKVIAESPTDVQPVFDAIAESAMRLLGGRSAAVTQVFGDMIHLSAHTATDQAAIDALQKNYPRPLSYATGIARVVRSGKPEYRSDIENDPDASPEGKELARTGGYRSILWVPLLRDGVAFGTINVARTGAGPFSDHQIKLLETFADQAVIAIQNVRLFNENKEALEQQTGTAEILRVISKSPTDIQPVLAVVAESAARLCEATDAHIWLREGNDLKVVASHGGLSISRPRVQIGRNSVIGRAAHDCKLVHVHDLAVAYGKEFPNSKAMMEGGYRSILAVPLIREGSSIGAILIRRTEVRPFAPKQLELLQTFADQSVIAIENVRLFNETKESLERQTATAEILRVIGGSMTDTQPVFDAIVKNCHSLFEGSRASLWLISENLLHQRASTGEIAGSMPIDRGSGMGACVLDERVIHLPDLEESAAQYPRLRQLGLKFGYRSGIYAPLLRDGRAIGGISVLRREAGAFDDKAVALLKTFTDQAVIAIENVRLFKEVEARTAALSKTVGQLTALGEVGQAISSTLDLETMLKTVVSRAVQLAGLDGGSIFEYDERAGEFQLRATENVDEEYLETLRSTPIRKGEGAVGRAGLTGEPVQIPDIQDKGYQTRLRDAAIRAGFRAVLVVPLLREGHVIGVLSVTRKSPGAFAPEVVDLLKTFASQSALALQNARLFREIAEKGKQLEVASQMKSQFLANMSHELRTPLNAIIGVTEMLHEDAVDLKREDELEPLERVLRAAKHLLALINDILDLSKVEAGKMDIHIESFAIAPLVTDVVQIISTMATKNENKVVVDCPANLGSMKADQTRIRQALLNLASNANKFTEHGTVTIAARRATEQGREWVTMAVTDTGIGLTPTQMGKLFQDFVQADASTTRKYGGTGLGLAISRRFCQMMGGDITVTSESGKGSTFTIRLPAEVGDVQPAAAAVRDAVAGARPGAAPSGAPTILVVDDDQTVREMMQRYLVREGFLVVTASGGQEGLRLARELQPAAITLDLMMPDLDGWTVLAAIKGDPELADIPVILVSIVDEKKRGYALGATDYMVKPVDRARLSGVLRDICGAVGRQVLLVDDDDMMRQGMRKVLEQDGWQVAEAENGRVALARLAESRPDIIMLDLMMPEMDGFEFLVEMRARAEWRDIPVLVVTAKDLTPEERSRLNGDVERVLQKGAAKLDEVLKELGRILPGSIARVRGKKAVGEAG